MVARQSGLPVVAPGAASALGPHCHAIFLDHQVHSIMVLFFEHIRPQTRKCIIQHAALSPSSCQRTLSRPDQSARDNKTHAALNGWREMAEEHLTATLAQ